MVEIKGNAAISMLETITRAKDTHDEHGNLVTTTVKIGDNVVTYHYKPHASRAYKAVSVNRESDCIVTLFD